jgi:hypothetical protein
MEDLDFKFERVLTFRHSEEVRQGKAAIGGMRFLVDRQKWECRVSLDYLLPEPLWPEGADQLEAFRICLFILSETILGATEQGWSVWWQREGDHGGFVDYE